jgi:hypothetical protein
VSGRPGYRLTAEAQAEREAFDAEYDRGNCSCHVSPPCGSCLHPGNPNNQVEDDSAWEPILSATDEERANKVAAYVNCHGGLFEGDKGCGLQALTDAQYTAQLSRPDSTWCCPKCGNSADYNDTESERVQGVNDEPLVEAAQTPRGWPYEEMSAERRAQILKEFDAAIDEPLPEGGLERANEVMAATKDERSALGIDLLMLVALFIDDLRVAHPEWDDIALRRVASDAMARSLMVLVRSARLREGRELNPARAAIASYFVAEQVLETARASGGDDPILDIGEPGQLRAEIERMAAEKVPA